MVIYSHSYIPVLPLQWSWLHVCVAMNCNKNSISVVVNGFRIEETPIPNPTDCPVISLGKNLVLQKGFIAESFWNQGWGRVTNLNIFDGIMSMEDMVARTSGEDCGKQDGDLLLWGNSSWSLEGSAKWTNVLIEDLCRKNSSIHLFSTQTVEKPGDCKELCPKLHSESRMASVETPDLFEKLKDRMNEIVSSSSRLADLILWLPMHQENNVWVDSYTHNQTKPLLWSPGYPINDRSRKCTMYTRGGNGYGNFPCFHDDGFYCSCHFPERPILSLRGLCKDSHIDQIYMPHNNPLDGELAYYGNSKTRAIFLDGENQWGLEIRVE